MAWGHGFPHPLLIRDSVERLIRNWPQIHVRIKRQVQETDEYGQLEARYLMVYTGPALSRPAGGTSETYGLGTVENYKLVILVNGVFNIRQGDIVTINDGRDYEVQFPPEHFGAFNELRLDQRSQVGQPT